MTSTPRTASTSDARKRQAEKDVSMLVDAIDLHHDALIEDARIEGIVAGLLETDALTGEDDGTPSGYYVAAQNLDYLVRTVLELATAPPPVPREPWRVISTDRDQPTLAKVTWKNGDSGGTFTAAVYVNSPIAPDWPVVMIHNGHDTQPIVGAHLVTDVELLHMHDPVTHLPVPREPTEAMVEAAAAAFQAHPGKKGAEAALDALVAAIAEVSR